jgi:hypothetical protein
MYRDEDGKVVRRGERGTNVSIYFSRRNRHILDSLYDLIDAGKISSISQFVNTAVEDKWKKDQVQQSQVQQPQVA